MDEIFKVFLTENDYGKISFSFWKIEFWTDCEICAYHRIFGFCKGPLARLYLKVKVYITTLLSIYKKTHALNNVMLFGFLHFYMKTYLYWTLNEL